MHHRCSTDGVSRFKACDSYILPAGCKEIIQRTGCARKPLKIFSFLEISGLHFSLLSSESSAGLPPLEAGSGPLEWKTCPCWSEQKRVGGLGESGQRLCPESEDPGSECGAGKREPGRAHSFPFAHPA